MNYNPNSAEVKELLESVLQRHFGCTAAEASRDQMYKAAAITVKNILSDKRSAYKKKVNAAGAKRVYYMCMEFLLGRSLKTNLCNLGLAGAYEKALKKLGFDLEDRYECERDVLADLPRALWSRFRRWIIPQRAFRSATSTDCSSK